MTISPRFQAALLGAGLLLGLGFRASPNSINDFRFAIVGDRTGETVPGVFEQVWQQIRREKPNFAITVGDTIQGLNDGTTESEWRAVRSVWASSHIPVYFTPGNHDIWSEASRRIYEQQTGRPAWYSFNYQNAHFTVLDNSGSLQLSTAQMQFLQTDLASNQARQPKFVFFHQPFWLLPLKLQSNDFPFHRLMRQYGVAYVVCGHVHQFSRLESDGIVYLVVGSSGGHLRGHDPRKSFAQGWFFHHLLVEVRGSKVDVSIQEAGEPYGNGRTLQANDWPR